MRSLKNKEKKKHNRIHTPYCIHSICKDKNKIREKPKNTKKSRKEYIHSIMEVKHVNTKQSEKLKKTRIQQITYILRRCNSVHYLQHKTKTSEKLKQ